MQCVKRLQHEDCPAYACGTDASYTLKMMIMKVAHKDWTAIDRQLIVSRAKAVKAMMLAVVHYGCEANLKPDGTTFGAIPLHLTGALQLTLYALLPGFPDFLRNIDVSLHIQYLHARDPIGGWPGGSGHMAEYVAVLDILWLRGTL